MVQLVPASLSAGVSWRSPAAELLLDRARREMARAEAADEPAERFRHAHLCAIRAASAVIAARQPPSARRRPRSVWELTAAAAPELRAWAAYFASGAPLRAAVEAGRAPLVANDQADHVLSMARLFLDVVEGSSADRAS